MPAPDYNPIDDAWYDLPASPGGDGGSGGSVAWADVTDKPSAFTPVRELRVLSTATLADGNGDSSTLALGGTVVLGRLAMTVGGRFRGYRTAAARDADVGRAPGSDPSASVGPELIVDAVLPDNGSLSMYLGVVAVLLADGVLYTRLDNRSGGINSVTASLYVLNLEEAG